MKAFATTIVLMALLTGCSTSAPSPALTQTDQKLATQAHWIAQPASASVTHDDYDVLWEACVGAARWRGFRIDRVDYRGGVMVSYPVVSKQLFEVWKRDVATIPDMAESTLATMRRIVRFEISEREDGRFECVPKVLVERYSASERRITSVTRYRESFSILPNLGSRERDKGVDIPVEYWYTTDRDGEMEKRLADAVLARLPRPSRAGAAVASR